MLFFDLGVIPMFFGGIAVIGFQVRNVRRLSKQSHAISPKPELDWRDRAVVRLQEMYAEGKIEEIDIAGDSLFERAIQTCLDAKSEFFLEADLRGMGLYDISKAPSVVECPPPIPAPPFTAQDATRLMLIGLDISAMSVGENHLIKKGTTYDHQYVPQAPQHLPGRGIEYGGFGGGGKTGGITQYYSSNPDVPAFNSPEELKKAADAALKAGIIEPEQWQDMLYPGVPYNKEKV